MVPHPGPLKQWPADISPHGSALSSALRPVLGVSLSLLAACHLDSILLCSCEMASSTQFMLESLSHRSTEHTNGSPLCQLSSRDTTLRRQSLSPPGGMGERKKSDRHNLSGLDEETEARVPCAFVVLSTTRRDTSCEAPWDHLEEPHIREARMLHFLSLSHFSVQKCPPGAAVTKL